MIYVVAALLLTQAYLLWRILSQLRATTRSMLVFYMGFAEKFGLREVRWKDDA